MTATIAVTLNLAAAVLNAAIYWRNRNFGNAFASGFSLAFAIAIFMHAVINHV